MPSPPPMTVEPSRRLNPAHVRIHIHRLQCATSPGGRPSDLAVLCDIRVVPGHRRSGVRHALGSHGALVTRSGMSYAGSRVAEHQHRRMPPLRWSRVRLGAIHGYAYPDYPEEAMPLWHFALGR